MAQKIRDIMTSSPITLDADSTVNEAAKAMRQHNIGDVIVLSNGQVKGIVTDRDLAVRVLAEGRSPGNTKLAEICSGDLVAVSPETDVDRVIQLVREHGIRRVPVVQNGKAVGVVSIGDLAIERDQRSALADVSAAAPNS